MMNIINMAASQKRTLSISYTDAKGNVTMREVEPYELRGDALFAHDVEKNGIRQFKLDNIGGCAMTENTFVPRHDIKIGGSLQ